MTILTIRCKLFVNPELTQELVKTSEAFAAGCNAVLQVSLEKKTHAALQLHHLTYHLLRKNFNLSANLAIRAIRRVSGSFSKNKRPKRFRPTSISYDARIFTFRENDYSVTLKTLHGRKKIFLDIGEYQKKALKGKRPTAATLVRRGKEWYLNIVIEQETVSITSEVVMGIDLGINHIAYTRTGLTFPGKARQLFKEKRSKIRASLQSKNTRKAKQKLKKLSGYEKRRIKHENHLLSKTLVEEAKRHDCGIIRMERLKAIREKTSIWDKHRNRMISGWSFYQLQQFVEYKAKSAGIRVEYISPAYTSQICCQCNEIGKRDREKFKCITCGEKQADWNAACVIAKGGAFVNRPKLTVCA